SVGFDIIGSRCPCRAATIVCRVTSPGSPCRVTLLRNTPECPKPLACGGIEGIEKPRQGALACGDSDNDFSINQQRSVSDGKALLIIIHDNIPDHIAGLGIQRDQMHVECCHVEAVAQNSKSAVRHHRALTADAVRQPPRVTPNWTACPGVQG